MFNYVRQEEDYKEARTKIIGLEQQGVLQYSRNQTKHNSNNTTINVLVFPRIEMLQFHWFKHCT